MSPATILFKVTKVSEDPAQIEGLDPSAITALAHPADKLLQD